MRCRPIGSDARIIHAARTARVERRGGALVSLVDALKRRRFGTGDAMDD
jgi:hypothetical protein